MLKLWVRVIMLCQKYKLSNENHLTGGISGKHAPAAVYATVVGTVTTIIDPEVQESCTSVLCSDIFLK